ncbi:MAG: 3-hydroxyacyl-CoA dehydrogenase [Gammaproteobacteria bacterium]|nr:MAG: 3-hydroxyacyl-CoA dehydrogenase [Gammaproteobacteria bacterium]
MGNLLNGQVAVVTGAGRGMGRAHALALAAEGAKIVVNDLGGSIIGEGGDASPADDVVKEIVAGGGEAVANYGNVTSVADGTAMIEQAMDHFGRLDIVINNAGNIRNQLFVKMSEADWDSVIAVHLKALYAVTRQAAQIFAKQGSGRIVNTASEAGLGGYAASNYAAAKEGIVGFSRTLALELGPYGVTTNAIRPRAGTRMAEGVDMKKALDMARQGKLPLPEFMFEIENMLDEPESFSPDQVAPLVVFLCTEAASNINGRDFIVGGGEITLVSLPTKERSIFSDKQWTQEQLQDLIPKTLGKGVKNPAAPRQA